MYFFPFIFLSISNYQSICSPKKQKIDVNIPMATLLFLATSAYPENRVEWAETHKNSCEWNNGN